MKLELKHLAPYLPYDLEFYVQHANGTRLNNWCMTIDTDLRIVLERQNKPILRPLSDLTKEMNHEKNIVNFIPIRALQLHNHIKIDSDGLVTDGKDEYGINWLSYESFQLLLKWHFDVFGLIEQGLAIDINTLNN